MRDAQKKILERIETIVTSFNGQRTSLEFIVNHSRENSGRIYVQPVGSFANVIECGFIFESRFAVFDFGRIEMQVEYAKPETAMRVLDTFMSTVAAHLKGTGPVSCLSKTQTTVTGVWSLVFLVRYFRLWTILVATPQCL